MNQSTETIEGTDFKLSRSDLLAEIKEQIIILNENLTNGETELRFGRAAAQGAPQPLAEVYRALSQLVKLTREILSPDLLEDCVKELEEMYDIDTKAWKKREYELLQMVTDRDQDIETIQHDCELLDAMLEIVNPIIKSGEYSHVSREMRKLCREVSAFRSKYNIVG